MRDAVKNPPKSPGWEDGKGRFLIDGFPRKMDQAIEFDRSVSVSRLSVWDCGAEPCRVSVDLRIDFRSILLLY
jgi:adenylate kinase family enzyme